MFSFFVLFSRNLFYNSEIWIWPQVKPNFILLHGGLHILYIKLKKNWKSDPGVAPTPSGLTLHCCWEM